MAMRPAFNLALLMVAAAFAGCASTAPIAMGNDTYMISQTSAGGIFKSMSSLKSDVMTRANAFAESKGKVAIPIASQEKSAVPGRMPNFEYQFRLVDPDDPRASGGALIPRADMVVEVHNTNSPDSRPNNQPEKPKDVYAELVKLDDLRKKGIITDAEFEMQKTKVLASD